MRNSLKLAVVACTVFLTGCLYSGTGRMVLGPPAFAIDVEWNGSVGAKPNIMGFSVPYIFQIGMGADEAKSLVGPPKPGDG